MAGKAGHRAWGRIRQLPNKSKRWQASYVGPDLVRHNAPTTFTAKMDGEAWLAAERRAIERDEWTPPKLRVAEKKTKAVTVADYAATWLEHRNLKPRTRIEYRALLDNHVAPMLGGVPLKNLTPEAIRAWYASLGTQHPRRNSHAYALLHAICATAVTDGLIVANPCHLRGVMSTPRRREPVILSVPEVAALADAIEPERLRALVLVSAWCGTRWGEAIELRRKDVSGDLSVLYVARGATHRQGCRIDTPKSGRGRAVVVPPHIRNDLKYHLDAFVAKDPEALLFPPTRGGCHFSDQGFRGHLNPALASIGREGVRIHDLRHFAGTQTARVGNLVETMGRLGHSTVSASLKYQQIVSGRDHEVAEALSALATGGGAGTGLGSTESSPRGADEQTG